MLPMTRSYLLLAAIFGLALFTLTFTARVLGRTQSPPLLGGFGQGCADKPSPCWNGIVPGETDSAEQARLMRQSGYVAGDVNRLVTWYRAPPPSGPACQRVSFIRTQRGGQLIIHEIVLSDCTGLRAGDVMNQFGHPLILSSSVPMLFYEQGSLRAGFAGRSTSIFAELKNFRLSASSSLQLHAWRGFVPQWRYCQLEAAALECR
jgi:hypothetical protein